ncbi:L-lactate permease [Escherichia coli]|nr:L-lactate permease [Escherichia coli]QXA61778.1 L-lactate permease [Escherichia coli]QXB50118.1 L-lactate permease [Escherichia coli]
MIWQPEFTDKTLSRKPGAVHGVSTLIPQYLVAVNLGAELPAFAGSLVSLIVIVFMAKNRKEKTAPELGMRTISWTALLCQPTLLAVHFRADCTQR